MAEVESRWLIACTVCGREDFDLIFTDGRKPPTAITVARVADPCPCGARRRPFTELLSWEPVRKPAGMNSG